MLTIAAANAEGVNGECRRLPEASFKASVLVPRTRSRRRIASSPGRMPQLHCKSEFLGSSGHQGIVAERPPNRLVDALFERPTPKPAAKRDDAIRDAEGLLGRLHETAMGSKSKTVFTVFRVNSDIPIPLLSEKE